MDAQQFRIRAARVIGAAAVAIMSPAMPTTEVARQAVASVGAAHVVERWDANMGMWRHVETFKVGG